MKIGFYLLLITAMISFLTMFALQDSAYSEEEKRKLIKIIISAGRLWGENDAKIIHLGNGIKIEQAGMALHAQEGVYYTDSKVIEISGNVNFTRPGSKIKGDKVVVYPDRQFGAWKGHVEFLQEKGSSTPGKDKMNKAFKEGSVSLTCDALEFYWGTNNTMAIAKGNVKANQKDKYLYSDVVTYTEKPQKLLLEGNIRLGNEKGINLSCDRLTLYIEEERIHAEGLPYQGGLLQIELPLKKHKNQ